MDFSPAELQGNFVVWILHLRSNTTRLSMNGKEIKTDFVHVILVNVPLGKPVGYFLESNHITQSVS